MNADQRVMEIRAAIAYSLMAYPVCGCNVSAVPRRSIGSLPEKLALVAKIVRTNP